MRLTVMAEEAISQLLDVLKNRGSGNVLRGWWRALDKDGSMDCSYAQFCKAAKNLGFVGDTGALLALDDDASSLTFAELCPQKSAVFEKFRKWVKDMYGGPEQMLVALDSEQADSVTKDRFMISVMQSGFQATQSEIQELVDALDLSGTGRIGPDGFAYIETDNEQREYKFYQIRQAEKEKENSLLTDMFLESKRSQLPPAHRLSQRPWQECLSSHLRALALQKKCGNRRSQFAIAQESKMEFLQKVCSMYGNEVRAWRLGVDVKTNWYITEIEFRSYCRRIDFSGNVKALWSLFDCDRDGKLVFEEFCPKVADVLQRFQHWAKATFGRCQDLWESSILQSEIHRLPSSRKKMWASDKKMLLNEVHAVLVSLQYPNVTNKSHMKALLAALDLYGCGFWAQTDLEWLDAWEPPTWLAAKPNAVAWIEARTMMLKKHRHLLQVWRCLLDTDNSNRVSWTEFKTACERVKYQGDIGGAWRYLDRDLSGYISLNEIDQGSHEVLMSFKKWACENFGSVRLCFGALDRDKNGSLTFNELRDACRKYHWRGEVRLLFRCLDTDFGNSLQINEIAFVDSWDTEDDDIGAGSEVSKGSLFRGLPLLARGATPVTNESPMQSTSSSGRFPELGKRSKSSLPSTQGDPMGKTKLLMPSASEPEKRHHKKAATKTLCRTFGCPKLAAVRKPGTDPAVGRWQKALASKEKIDSLCRTTF